MTQPASFSDSPNTNDAVTLRERWLERFSWLAWPESLLGTMIVTTWSGIIAFAAGFSFGLPGVIILTVILASAGVLIHLAVVLSGSHFLWGLTTSGVFLVALLGMIAISGGSPWSLLIMSLTVVGYHETVRLSFGRRRDADIDDSVFAGSGSAMAVTALVSLVGFGGISFLFGNETNWLWVPVSVGILATLGLVGIFVPKFRLPKRRLSHGQRWKPGERIPPPPIRTKEDGPPLR